MQFLFTRPWLKSLAGLCINVSAAWFSLALISTQTVYMQIDVLLFSLSRNIFFGILFLVFSVEIERHLEKYDRS